MTDDPLVAIRTFKRQVLLSGLAAATVLGFVVLMNTRRIDQLEAALTPRSVAEEWIRGLDRHMARTDSLIVGRGVVVRDTCLENKP